jgi:flagellar biosynthesis GTPase FlhF
VLLLNLFNLGESDSLIDLDWGKATSVQFHINGFDVQFRTYPHVDHEISDRELVDLFHWMKNRLLTATEEMNHPQKEKQQRKQNYLDSKYDSMTAELKEMEGKLSEEMGEEEDEGKKESKSQEKSPSTNKKDSKEETKKPDRVNCFPFSIEYLDDKPMTIVKVRIHFEVPSE